MTTVRLHAVARARRRVLCWSFALTFTLAAVPARADEVHVMVSGAFTAAYDSLVATWERSTGHHVTTQYGASMGATPAAIPNRLARGEHADVVILAREALDALAAQGRVAAGSQVDLARSRIGVAVKSGARTPDISSEATFRQTLLDATSIAYSDSASGVYIATEMLAKLGIAKQVSRKARKVEGTPVGEVVARGDAEIGLQQISELLPVRGITFVGPIPDSLQRVTTFSAGVTPMSHAAAAARQLVAYLTSAAAAMTVRATGLDPIVAATSTQR